MSESFLQFLHTDEGGEYDGVKFESKLRTDGVLHESSASYTQEQNGLAEQMNQTLANTATTILIDSGLP
jgi:hypothetical protein